MKNAYIWKTWTEDLSSNLTGDMVERYQVSCSGPEVTWQGRALWASSASPGLHALRTPQHGLITITAMRREVSDAGPANR